MLLTSSTLEMYTLHDCLYLIATACIAPATARAVCFWRVHMHVRCYTSAAAAVMLELTLLCAHTHSTSHTCSNTTICSNMLPLLMTMARTLPGIGPLLPAPRTSSRKRSRRSSDPPPPPQGIIINIMLSQAFSSKSHSVTYSKQ
jgi:hypothetical protein